MDLSNDSVEKLVESLVKRESELSDELKFVQSELVTIQDRYRSVEKEHRMVAELLRLHGQPGDCVGRDTAQGDAAGFRAVLLSILTDAGEPMHVSDIEEELMKRRIPIPGKGNTANIISHLVRASDEISRVASGTYALTSHLSHKEKSANPPYRGGTR